MTDVLDNATCIATETVVCKICHKRFSGVATLRVHYIEHFQGTPSACQVCHETFTSAEDFGEHCAQHAQYTCLVCTQIFWKKSEFESHETKHHLLCEFCQKTFRTANEFEIHLRLHKAKTFQCTQCSKYFKNKYSLNNHKVIHTGEKPYECPVCYKSFSHSGTLSKHSMIHSSNTRPYGCELCGRSFAMKVTLQTHMLNHEGKKPYCCVICNKQYADIRQFKRHGRQHAMNMQKCVCDLCGKVFTNPNSLRLHFQLHTDDGAFRCNVCHRSFNHSSSLKRHKMWHSDARPFQCGFCSKAFIERHRLQHHLRFRHSNESAEVHEEILAKGEAERRNFIQRDAEESYFPDAESPPEPMTLKAEPVLDDDEEFAVTTLLDLQVVVE